jgi:purine-nucleoside phosphorylase
MMTLEEGMVRPVCTRRTPQLGPTAIMAATDADLQILRKRLSLPDSRKLFLGRLYFDASDQKQPALAGPLMGAPYAVMVLETLRAWGVRSVVFCGWCGTIADDLVIGDILIPDCAIIDEGTSLHYKQAHGGTVYPNAGRHRDLQRSFRQHTVIHKYGPVWSTDGIFRETPGQIRKFQQKGAVAVEMELSALFSAAKFYDLSIAAVLIVSDELFSLQWRPGFKNKLFKQSRITVCGLLSQMHRSPDHG